METKEKEKGSVSVGAGGCCGLVMIRAKTLSPWSRSDWSYILLMGAFVLSPLMPTLSGTALGL